MKPDKFKPLKARFRATFAGSQLGTQRIGEIDTENEVLHDVQITLEGEALGHGIWLDREFCEAVAAAGNATGDVGLKVRYGHPAMCSDAIGTELGRAKNFRVVDVERDIEGEKVQAAGVVADVHLLKSAHSAPQGDIVKHVMETAAEDPKQFGQSIVFTYADWVVKDADGNRHSYKEEVEDPFEKWEKENPDATAKEWYGKQNELHNAWFGQSADGKVYAVLGKLHGSDFTDTPAATDGIFSTGTLAEEAEQMLDEHPQILEVLEKNPKSVVEFLERTGLAEKVESARLSGLQAAKDKEIAALQQELKEARETPACYGEIEQERDKLKAEKADLDDRFHKLTDAYAGLEKELAGKNAEIENFKSVIEANQKDLAAAKEHGEQLSGELETTRADLAATREHLAAWEAHASDHGANVNTPPGDVFSDFAQAVKTLGYTEAARKFPALRDAYNIKHKKTHKE